MKNDIEKQAEAPSSPTTMTTVIGDDGDKSSDGHAEPNIDTHVPCHETHQLPPDGGWYAWSTVAGCFLALFVQFGIPNSYGVFQSYYETHLLSDHSPQDISWIGGIQQFLLFFGGLFAGRAMDAYGAHAVFLPGSFLLVLSLMLTSISTKYWQIILAQGVLFGLGSALIFSPAFSLPSQWFHKRRALATSVAVTGSGLGGTLWPIVFSRLFQQIG
jgi:MFS family permease